MGADRKEEKRKTVGTKLATRGLGRQKRLEARNRKAQDTMKPDILIHVVYKQFFNFQLKNSRKWK